jgi:hypothetical protein
MRAVVANGDDSARRAGGTLGEPVAHERAQHVVRVAQRAVRRRLSSGPARPIDGSRPSPGDGRGRVCTP